VLGGLTPAAWDQLAGRSFYSTSAWLTFCAAEYGGPSEAVVSDGAAAPFVTLREPPSRSAYSWADALSARGLPAPPPTGLLVGPREGYQTHLLGPTAAAADLVEQLRSEAADLPCVAMYLPTSEVHLLRQAGVTAPPVLLEADAWIHVPEGGSAEWLAALSKKRRRSARDSRRAFREAGYTITHLPLAEAYEQLAVAAAATLTKYGHDAQAEGERLALRSHAVHMVDAAKVAVCSLGGGDPVGFCLYYVWADTIFLRWAGFDYSRLAGAAEYFNVVLFSQIELAAELGLRWVHAGVKSTVAKALYGARLHPLWLVDLTRDSVLASVPGEVRRHNASVHEQLLGDPRTASALDSDTWFREWIYGGTE
jgi:hypothetical protein